MFTSIDVNNFRFHLSVLRNIQLKEMFCPTEIPTQMGVVNPSIWICCSCYVFGHQFGFSSSRNVPKNVSSSPGLLGCCSFSWWFTLFCTISVFLRIYFLQIFPKKLIYEQNLNTNNLLSNWKSGFRPLHSIYPNCTAHETTNNCRQYLRL